MVYEMRTSLAEIDSQAAWPVLDKVPGMIWSVGPDKAGLFFNRSWLEFTGRSLIEQTGAGWLQAVHPQDVGALMATLDGAQEGVSFSVEVRLRRSDGKFRWMLLSGAARYTATGEFEGYMGSALDVSDHKMLVAEIDHRIINSFAAIKALVSLSVRKTQSKEAYAAALESRIDAYVRAQSLLAKMNWRGAYLRHVVLDALSALPTQTPAQLKIEGGDVLLTPRATVSLNVVANELGLNASQHGALTVPEGRLRVGWRIERDHQMLNLEWEEQGGPPVKAPKRTGLGLRLVQQILTHDLDAIYGIDYARSGLRMKARMPLGKITTTAVTANKAVDRPRAVGNNL